MEGQANTGCLEYEVKNSGSLFVKLHSVIAEGSMAAACSLLRLIIAHATGIPLFEVHHFWASKNKAFSTFVLYSFKV